MQPPKNLRLTPSMLKGLGLRDSLKSLKGGDIGLRV